MEPPPPEYQTPLLPSKDRRFKPIWRILLISNLALGAYIFAKARKKNSSTEEIKGAKTGSERAKVVVDVSPTSAVPEVVDVSPVPAAPDVVDVSPVPDVPEVVHVSLVPATIPPIPEETPLPPPPPRVPKPVKEPEPIPEDQQRVLFKWLLEEKRKAWDLSSHLNALAESETEGIQGTSSVFNQAPLVNFHGHKDEGYAIDWSTIVPGRPATGDCKNCIHLWEPTSGSTWNVDATPYTGHSASVEDIQRSPTEPHAFVSCSVDGTIAIWDTRLGKSPAFSFKAHEADVNVISWNRQASFMLASGSDDGTFSIHDFRLLKEGNTVVAHFKYHKYPVTSIEWSPHEASTLAVSSSDNQLTIWDLSLEKDQEEEAEFKAQTKELVNAPEDLPPQLLFVHQKDLKELHWHTQIPGMVVSTAADGFNILMPSNIQSTLPSNVAA